MEVEKIVELYEKPAADTFENLGQIESRGEMWGASYAEADEVRRIAKEGAREEFIERADNLGATHFFVEKTDDQSSALVGLFIMTGLAFKKNRPQPLHLNRS